MPENQIYINPLQKYLQDNLNPQIAEAQAAHAQWVLDNQKPPAKITSQKEYQEAADKLDYAKRSLKQIEEARLKITAPFRDVSNKVNTHFKIRLETPLNEIIGNYNKSITEYAREQKRLADEAAAKQLAEIARQKAEAEAKAAEQGKLAAVQPILDEKAKEFSELAIIENKVQTTVAVTNGKSLSITYRYVFDEENSSLEALVKAAAADPELLKYLEFNIIIINKFLKPTKSFTPAKVAGVEFKEEVGTRSN